MSAFFLPAHEAENSAHIHDLMRSSTCPGSRRNGVWSSSLLAGLGKDQFTGWIPPCLMRSSHITAPLSFTIRSLDLRLRSYHSCSLDQAGSGMFSRRFPAYRIPDEFVKELNGRHVRIDMDALVDRVIVQDKLQRRWNKAINVFRNGPEV
jgi:hypothetical protein